MKNRTCRVALTMMALTLTAIQSHAQSIYEPYTFSTLAGNAGYGSADGTGSAARFSGPSGVTVDSAGNVFVAETVNHTILKVTPVLVRSSMLSRTVHICRAHTVGNAAGMITRCV